MSDLPLPPEAVEAAAKAYRSIQHAAIGAAPEGMDCKMAYYFYEYVEQGHGYGQETHPPLPCPDFDNPRVDNYPEIVVHAAIHAFLNAMGVEYRTGSGDPNSLVRLVSDWFPVEDNTSKKAAQ